MCKYSSRDDDGYYKVVRKLQGSCDQIKRLREAKAAEERADRLNKEEQCEWLVKIAHAFRISLNIRIVTVDAIDSGLNLEIRL
jgi:hypothetical protein